MEVIENVSGFKVRLVTLITFAPVIALENKDVPAPSSVRREFVSAPMLRAPLITLPVKRVTELLLPVIETPPLITPLPKLTSASELPEKLAPSAMPEPSPFVPPEIVPLFTRLLLA